MAAALALVLHGHIPYVLGHDRWPHGSDWLCEAAAETYLPLIGLLRRRAERGAPGCVTLSLTPVLCEQLAAPAFVGEFREYLEARFAAATEDRATFARSGDDRLRDLAESWQRFYRNALEDFLGAEGPQLVARFRRLAEAGVVEIVGGAATHAYLPLLDDERAIRRQLFLGRRAHRRHFGVAPEGLWLPECAWPESAGAAGGADAFAGTLEQLGFHYCFVDPHSLRHAEAGPVRGKGDGPAPRAGAAVPYPGAGAGASVLDPGAGVAVRGARARTGTAAGTGDARGRGPYRVEGSDRLLCVARDPDIAFPVWSRDYGYPGDAEYLEFHKKRDPGGLRYWSVTDPRGPLDGKRVYGEAAAARRAREHGGAFARALGAALVERGGDGCLAALFDAELFGHWWFEGPQFLDAALDALEADARAPIGVGARLAAHPPRERVRLSAGSWGEGGDDRMWWNPSTGSAWATIRSAGRRFQALLDRATRATPDPLLDRLVAQCARELCLLESSDWTFLITTGTARDYAERRIAGHAADVADLAAATERHLAGAALTGAEADRLDQLERRDTPFSGLDVATLSGL